MLYQATIYACEIKLYILPWQAVIRYLRSRILSVISAASWGPSMSSTVADGSSVITSQLTGFQFRTCTVPVRRQYTTNTLLPAVMTT